VIGTVVTARTGGGAGLVVCVVTVEPVPGAGLAAADALAGEALLAASIRGSTREMRAEISGGRDLS